MAKQIAGLCRLEGTFDQLTFYKMEGQYYVRVKSSLTSKRVKTAPEFRYTMLLAGLMARASKIGAQVYKALPPGWRQFWMYRSFTGEALLLLKHNPYTDEQVKQILWKCYVGYWEQRKAADPGNPIFQPKPQKIRKRRVYTEESWKRRIYRKDRYGRYKYPDLVKADKERIKREAKEAWAKACEEKRIIRLYKARNEAYVRLRDNHRQAQQKTSPVLSGFIYITSNGKIRTMQNDTRKPVLPDAYTLQDRHSIYNRNTVTSSPQTIYIVPPNSTPKILRYETFRSEKTVGMHNNGGNNCYSLQR